MSSINAMDPLHAFFETKMHGASVGAFFALYSVRNILGHLLVAPASDLFGRRYGMIAGSVCYRRCCHPGRG